jgi:nucleoid-associated protein YgaU
MTDILTQKQIKRMLVRLGLKRRAARIGAAIALCEAPWEVSEDGQYQANFSAIGDQELADEVWGYSYGGFQIRSLRSQKGTGLIRDEDKLLDPVFNCTSAIAIRKAFGSWNAWSTYKSGMYKAYLQDLYPPPPNTYIVVYGDTLMNITDSISNGEWTWEELAFANNLTPPFTIYIGQNLFLPN